MDKNTETLPPHTEIIGSFEPVCFPALGIDKLLAKVDTGAYTGALHCSSVELHKRSEDGKRVLSFTPSNQPGVVYTVEKYIKTPVKSSSGHKSQRYIIETEIIVKGKKYTTLIGLADRSNMQCEVLLGRRFIRENNMLVDVRLNQELDEERKGKE